MVTMAYDPADKFCAGHPGEIVLVGCSPTNEEITEAQARIAAGEPAEAVWAEVDARCAERFRQRQLAGDTLPT
jgi:hypothetical protein